MKSYLLKQLMTKNINRLYDIVTAHSLLGGLLWNNNFLYVKNVLKWILVAIFNNDMKIYLSCYNMLKWLGISPKIKLDKSINK